ncbi:MAG: pyridoxamine 5'-phosphate oxidase family protein [Rikenellaceae bacterium]
MKKALLFLHNNREVAFATSSQDSAGVSAPKIRVFQIMDMIGSDLYFATAAHKDVYRELQENPNVELLVYKGNISVRITGKAIFDVSELQSKKIFSENPVLPRLYPSYDAMVYFRIPIAKIDYFDLEPTPPLFEHFEINS